jgi:hypothetical protein
MRYLLPFRLAFVLFALALVTATAGATWEAFRDIDVTIRNDGPAEARFDFHESVVRPDREVFFLHNAYTYRAAAGEQVPMALYLDGNRRLYGIYVEGRGETRCEPGHRHYRIRIGSENVGCEPTGGSFQRWLANVRFSSSFLQTYGRALHELLSPDA